MSDPDFAADEEILKGAEERAGKATPGPWHAENQQTHLGETAARTTAGWVLRRHHPTRKDFYDFHGYDADDAEFIAAARTDVPALAAIARKYQLALKRYELALWQIKKRWADANKQANGLGFLIPERAGQVAWAMNADAEEAAAEVRRILEGGE